MKFPIAVLASLLPVLSFAEDVPKSLFWRMPEGDVERVKIGGSVVWPFVPYETNGLVGFWDAKWNAGLGTHDSSAMNWANLAPRSTWTASFSNNAYAWGPDYIEPPFFAVDDRNYGGSNFQGAGNRWFSTDNANYSWSNMTIEVVAFINNPLVGGHCGGFTRWGQWSDVNGFTVWHRAWSDTMSQTYLARRTRFVDDSARTTETSIQLGEAGNIPGFYYFVDTYNYDEDTLRSRIFKDGEWFYAEDTGGHPSVLSGKISFAVKYGHNYTLRVHSIRVYDRVLSDDEIKRNADIDVVRFGGGDKL